MNNNVKNPALLPSGFVDLLPPDAGIEADAISALMDVFLRFGYARVKPPLVEFEESLFAPGPGKALLGESFRVMDPVSHRMMGVRSDTTAQIARIAASRLGAEKRPLRLTYANDVLRTKASQQRIQRQFTQVGCELIGDESVQADIESCVLALLGMRALGVVGVTLDLCIPRLIGRILKRYELPEVQELSVLTMLSSRDSDAVKALENNELSDVLEKLLSVSGLGKRGFEILESLELCMEEQDEIKRLRAVYDGVKAALEDLSFSDVSLTIDPVENKGFEYHCGLGFTLFAHGISGELGRGGRYMSDFAEQGDVESAVGFTLYMDTLRKIMPEQPSRNVVFVSHDERWSAITSLQSEGYIVLRGRGREDNGEDMPERCTHFYKDGKIEEI